VGLIDNVTGTVCDVRLPKVKVAVVGMLLPLAARPMVAKGIAQGLTVMVRAATAG
jgi:hypothetical protein